MGLKPNTMKKTYLYQPRTITNFSCLLSFGLVAAIVFSLDLLQPIVLRFSSTPHLWQRIYSKTHFLSQPS
nr:MAG TPA: hypothetical protein [Caudoviricetes sp.]